ncbi:MAG TPA: hypothetical protein VET23_06895 [Chitinophagaceae bacterium]|nr:hypothetical protein [Chitinophagaceae bacterium]
MYKGIFDERHKMILSPIAIEPVEKRFIKTPSDGEYEGGLLCDDCDNKLLGDYYENYASRAIYGGELLAEECPTFKSFRNQHGMEFIKCNKLNYHKFKLFLLSILWRASISTRPFFSEINLNEHEERIRQMLLSKNAGDVSEYPIVVMTYAHDSTLPKELIAQPRFVDLGDNIHLYSFMINGYFYFFYVSHNNSNIPEFALSETIKPNNELNILIIPKDRGWDFILGQSGIKNEPIQRNVL